MGYSRFGASNPYGTVLKRVATPETEGPDPLDSQLLRDIRAAQPNSFWCLRIGVRGRGVWSWACINFDCPEQFYVENDLFNRSSGGDKRYQDRGTWEIMDAKEIS